MSLNKKKMNIAIIGAGIFGLAVDNDHAGAALLLPATELRPLEPKIVAEHINQRRLPIDIEVMFATVNVDINLGHALYGRGHMPSKCLALPLRINA